MAVAFEPSVKPEQRETNLRMWVNTMPWLAGEPIKAGLCRASWCRAPVVVGTVEARNGITWYLQLQHGAEIV